MARQWQTVLVSVVAHVVGMFLVIVVPLLAFDAFPELRSVTEYIPVEMKVPDLPSAPRPATAAPTAIAPPSGPPLVAPDNIPPEVTRPVISINVPGVEGGRTDFLNGTPSISGLRGVEPPLQQASSAPIRPGGNVKPPDRIFNVRPEYPPIAVSARVAGSVIIEAIIGTDGLVRDARVLRSIPLLDNAALGAVRQWRYTPTLLNGVPVAVIITVTVTFTLDRLVF